MSEERLEMMGRDLDLSYAISGGYYEDVDFVVRRSNEYMASQFDLSIVSNLDAISQAIVNRLKTRKGELTPLGHPEYGSKHHELIGEPNTSRTRNLIKFYILKALKHEPRIKNVECLNVFAEHSPPRDSVRIELSVTLIEENTPLNLVIPFSLKGVA